LSDVITFTIPGRLRGKGRPRATVRGGFVKTYTDEKTRSCEGLVRHFASQAMGGAKPFDGPIALSVLIYLNTPASWPKKRKAAAYHATGKPDADNVLKLIGDSCNAIVWRDDSQISDIRMKRRYTDDQERVEIVVTALTRPAAIARAAIEKTKAARGEV